MKNNYRLITEDKLRQLLYAYAKLEALEQGESIGDFLFRCAEDLGIPKDEVEDFGLDSLVEEDLKEYSLYVENKI